MNTDNKTKASEKDSFEPAEIKAIEFETNDVILTTPFFGDENLIDGDDDNNL